MRIDDPMQSGACDECTHCIKVKRSLKCDQVVKSEKYVACREIRVCGNFNRTYKVEGLTQ